MMRGPLLLAAGVAAKMLFEEDRSAFFLDGIEPAKPGHSLFRRS